MQINEREIVLLELAHEFLDFENYERVLDALAKDDLRSVECNILINIDGLFESEDIDFETAKLAYERLNLDPEQASQFRQKYFLEVSFFEEITLN